MQSLHFTFLDGAFRYDCASCGQACCRGKGVALDAGRELVPLLKRAPAVASLLSPLVGGYVRLPDLSDGCWFLQGDGLCAYEVEHGREAKFATCRLFPFNRVFRAGSLRVVDYNSVVCPLQDAHGTGAGVSHAELTSELAALGEGPLLASALPLPDGARELRWPVLEQQVLQASQPSLNAASYLPYAAEQLAGTRQHLGLRGGAAGPPALEQLSALVTSWVALFGEPSAHAQVTTRRMALLTPSLRFNTLFRRGSAPYRDGVLRLPAGLLAAWFLSAQAAAAYAAPRAGLGAAAGTVPGQALSLRGLSELYQAQAGLRDLLARLDEVAWLTQALPAADLPPELAAVCGQLSRRLLRAAGPAPTAGGSLGQALSALAADLPSEQRPLLPALLLRAGDALRFA